MNQLNSGRLNALPAAEHITEAYQRYLRTIVPIADDRIRDAVHAQLSTDGLVRGPFLEATPAYARGASLRDLVDQGVVADSILELDGPALPMGRPLYVHQEAAVRKARAGRNVVVATGTGSGKTESFLLPILAELAQQQAQGQLTAGVRALLLYPMNALANDQVLRLRGVLRDAQWITFGRYTGETLESAKEAAKAFDAQNPGVPRLKNELLSREEMRATPPHILLTNYAMLEYLLLRPQDLDLFDPAADTWRFIVVDEAHVYDGAKGTEVGMLVRRLKDRVRASQLQAIATSATVGSDSEVADVAQFATNLFDLPIEWDPQDASRQDVVRATRVHAATPRWTAPDGCSFAATAALPREADLVAEEPTVHDPWLAGGGFSEARAITAESALASVARPLLGEVTATRALSSETHVTALREALLDGPRAVPGLAAELFGDVPGVEDELAGLVDLAAGLRDADGNPVIAARYHLWVNAADGAYVCLHPEGHHGYLRERGTCEACDAEGRRGVPVWQFAACQRCTTGYVHGRIATDLPNVRTWLALRAGDVGDDEDEAVAEGRAAVQGMLCPACARLSTAPVCRCGVQTRPVTVVPTDDSDPDLPRSTPPRRCVACGGHGANLIRGLAAGPDASTSVLATATYEEIPAADADVRGGARKLLAFSDSRQQAAYFAPYLQSGYTRMLWRRLFAEAVAGAYEANGGEPVSYADVLARSATLVAQHRLVEGDVDLAVRREIGAWLLAELTGFDERNSLEGTGLVQVTLAPGTIPMPPPLLALGLTQQEAWWLVQELLTTVRRAGAVQLPANLDIDTSHEAFGPRQPTWGFDLTSPDPRRRAAAWLPERGVNKRRSYVERVLAALEQDPAHATDVLKGLWSWITQLSQLLPAQPIAGGRILRQLALDRVRFAPGGEQFRCSTCQRWSAGSVRGVCPTLGCAGTVVPATVPEAHSDDNHYRRLYRELAPASLVAQEHTAQWSAKKAAEIQRAFIDGSVNVLSCSTTFELGVDVGELQTVLLRNVPPTTANYVQRAGRAGRRGAAAALVLTFARNLPHDQAMFRDPLAMIAGSMRAPYVPTDNERIARRHAHSIAFSAFFRHMFEDRGLTWATMEQFFSPEISPSGPDLLAEYLAEVPAGVAESALRVVPAPLHGSLGLADGSWAGVLVQQVYDLRDLYRGERAELVEARSLAVAQDNFRQAAAFDSTRKTLDDRRLLDRLATNNVLPKYGFPVDVVELGTFHLDYVGRTLELSRDLAMAISEYAPGSRIVAGGKVIVSGGLSRRPGKAWPGYKIGTCKGWDKHFVMRGEAADFPSECPDCGEPVQEMRAVRPEFGFVAERASEKVGVEPPRRSPMEPARVLRLSSDPQERSVATPLGSVRLTWGKRAEFAVVANGPKRQGWWLCSSCGRGIPAGESSGRRGSKPQSSHTNPVTGKDCTGAMKKSRLVHTFETDAFAVSLPWLPSKARESVLAALVTGASDALEVPLSDIGGSLYPSGAATRLVIYDTVPAGAGNAIRIGERFEEIVAHALARVSECACGVDSSCYACLRHHGNQFVHEDLTRAAAIAGLEGLGVRAAGSGVAEGEQR